jgi:hypothetical protein
VLLIQQHASSSNADSRNRQSLLSRISLKGAFEMLSIPRDPSPLLLILGGFAVGATMFQFGWF